ncbi:glycoside hydrolase family 71 protein [Ceratobasidium sp. AG-I]|nr:glycoside hydrolase family 71 protein [Ceratobasidium sp. AG-I]
MKRSVFITCGALLVKGAAAASVFAHFMAQNSYKYSQDDWANEINPAAGIGIDGFALNLAGYEWEPESINNAYAAAEARGSFSFFYSFDMGSDYPWDVGKMTTQITSHASSARTYRWNGKVLVSTYAGSNRGDAFWNQLKTSCANAGVPIAFAPAFNDYRDPAGASGLISKFTSIDGFFNWWSWPEDNGQLLTTATDLAFQSAIKKNRSGPYIMAVSPWQFKELGGTQDWVQLSDTLWDYRWKQAINDVKPDIVEIISWNDYAESHYIADINTRVDLGTVASQYVYGFPHAAWRIVAQYYIKWYKNGSAPAVTNDQVVFWYRSHPKAVTCSQGDLPRNSQYPADAVIALALLSSPATIMLDIGSKHFQWNAPAGSSTGSVAFPPEDGQIPYLQIVRNGVKIKDGYGSVSVTNSCSIYNFNPFVGVIG